MPRKPNQRIPEAAMRRADDLLPRVMLADPAVRTRAALIARALDIGLGALERDPQTAAPQDRP